MGRSIVSLTVFWAAASAAQACGNNAFLSEVQDYNNGKYEEAVQLGAASIIADPKNDQAHYYEALALSKLDRMDEAQTAYKDCAAITKDPRLKDYCEEAIKFLDIDYNKTKDDGLQPGSWVNGQFKVYSYSEIQEFKGRDTMLRRQAAHDIAEINDTMDVFRPAPKANAKNLTQLQKLIEDRKARLKEDLLAVPPQYREDPSNE